MLTFFAVLFRILVNPLANAFQKGICARGQSPLVTNFLTYAALSVVVLPLASQISWEAVAGCWKDIFGVGLLGALGNGFLVKAMRSGELSVLGPINAWKSVVGIVFGMILLREFPGSLGLLGVLLIVAGSYFVIAPRTSKEPFHWSMLARPDLRYRVAAMIFAAVEAVLIKRVILVTDATTAFALWCWGGAFFSFLLLPMMESELRTPDGRRREWSAARSNLPLFFGVVASVGLMQLTTNYALANMPVGYALALFQLSAVLSVFYGRLFFNEKGILRKLLASTVMVAGSVLIILGG